MKIVRNRQRKKNILIKRKILGLLLVGMAVLLFVSKDAFLYKESIVKVMEVENTFAYTEEGPNGEEENYYNQKLTTVLLNGTGKGDTVMLDNTFSSSGVNDERYRKGNQLFVSVKNGAKKGTIIGRKRDVYMITLIVLFLSLLLLLNGWQGGLIFISLILNIAIFLLALWQYGRGYNVIRLAELMMLVFSVLTLIFAGGLRKKTAAAIISTLLTTLFCYGIYELVLHFSERLPYEMMDYVVNPADLSDLFLVGVLMGSLGAVMDVSISIAAGVSEIVQKSPDIGLKPLIHSIREMGYDIMGTMISVLLFTYISGAIPILVVKIKNGYTLYHLFHFQMVFEIVRFLMGAIGIVLAIPVAGVCSVLLLHRSKTTLQ